jgi:hypothetical protein
MKTSTGTARKNSVMTVTGTRIQARSERRPMARMKPRASARIAASPKAARVRPRAPKICVQTALKVNTYQREASN